MKTAIQHFAKYSILPFLLMFLASNIALSQGAVDKKEAARKKLETALNTAKANHAKAERKFEVADSLIADGTTKISEAKAQLKANANARKGLDKAHAAQLKGLQKRAGGKDKSDAAEAKAEIKALEAQYKLDVKESDTELKAATKKLTTGEANLSKGKDGKKAAEASIKTAEASLEAAQNNYDVATGAVTPKGKGGKKK
jgi:chromosome segregation ATPase